MGRGGRLFVIGGRKFFLAPQVHAKKTSGPPLPACTDFQCAKNKNFGPP